jgi:hypothetical protein
MAGSVYPKNGLFNGANEKSDTKAELKTNPKSWLRIAIVSWPRCMPLSKNKRLTKTRANRKSKRNQKRRKRLLTASSQTSSSGGLWVSTQRSPHFDLSECQIVVILQDWKTAAEPRKDARHYAEKTLYRNIQEAAKIVLDELKVSFPTELSRKYTHSIIGTR